MNKYLDIALRDLLLFFAVSQVLARKRLLYRYVDINFTFLEYFHVKKVKYNQKKLFVSYVEALPVVATILNF